MRTAMRSCPTGYPFRPATDDEASQLLAAIFAAADAHLAAEERADPGIHAQHAAKQQAAMRRLWARLAMTGWPRPLAIDGHAYHHRTRRRTRSRRHR